MAQDGNVESFTQSGFRISSRKAPILKASPIEALTSKIGITIPEMIFGDNFIKLEHIDSGWGIEFNASDALDRVDKTGDSMLQVSYSKEWQKNRQHVHSDIKEVVKPFDWSYSTDYQGTILSSQTKEDSSQSIQFQPSEQTLPVHLLTRPDPILFFSTVDLFEDELADNGMSILSVKVRVMPQRLLLLSRFFLRLDGVIFRIRDTRIYIEFETGEVIREYTSREQDYEAIKSQLKTAEDATSLMRDPDNLSKLCPVVENKLEKLVLPVSKQTVQMRFPAAVPPS